jgi:hypothetical protein
LNIYQRGIILFDVRRFLVFTVQIAPDGTIEPFETVHGFNIYRLLVGLWILFLVLAFLLFVFFWVSFVEDTLLKFKSASLGIPLFSVTLFYSIKKFNSFFKKIVRTEFDGTHILVKRNSDSAFFDSVQKIPIRDCVIFWTNNAPFSFFGHSIYDHWVIKHPDGTRLRLNEPFFLFHRKRKTLAMFKKLGFTPKDFSCSVFEWTNK